MFVWTQRGSLSRSLIKAGSRRSDAHWQLDLKYIQNFHLKGRVQLQLDADLFNVFDRQTGYNVQPGRSSSEFGLPRSYFDPRRLQIAARLLF